MKRSMAPLGVSFTILALAWGGSAARAEDEVQAVAQNMPGFKAEMRYQDLGRGENVNVVNGGLTVTHASVIHLPGNMGSDLRPVRVYNSKLAADGFDDIFCSDLDDEIYGPLGFGWRIGYGRVFTRHYRKFTGEIGGGSGGYQYHDFWDYYYEDESGAQHHLFPLGGHTYNEATHSPAPVWYVTNDGSYIRAKYQPSIAQWVLYFPDGSARRAGDPAHHGFVAPDLSWGPDNPPVGPEPVVRNPFGHGWYVTAIEDRAHNVTTIHYVPYDAAGHAGTTIFGGAIDYVEDSFDRRIIFAYGVQDPVPSAPYLLRQISQATGGTTSRSETFTYSAWANATNSCALQTWPLLTRVGDPSGLQTLYTYADPVPSGHFRPYLSAIYYPTGAVSTYVFAQYRFNTVRYWHNHLMEDPPLQGGAGYGVASHTVVNRPSVGASPNRLTWLWKRSIDTRRFLLGLDPSYDFPVHPIITMDPLGTEEVRYVAEDDDPDCALPPGTEILTVRRRPGATPLDPVAINSLPANDASFSVWDQVVSWTHKRYESGDYQGGTPPLGDAHRCYDVGWPQTDTPARFGNIRPYDVIQAERDATGTERWKKETLSILWDGFGEFRKTGVTDLSAVPSPEEHFSGFVWDPPEEIPAFTPDGWTERSIVYQTDLKTLTYAGAEIPGQGSQYRVVTYARQNGDTGLVTGQRFLRDVQSNPTSPATSSSDKVLAITYTNALNPDGTTDRGNISRLVYSGGDSAATYEFDFAWDHGMVSRMERAGSPYGVEFTRAIDPYLGRITSNTDPNSLVTAFAYDDLDRLTAITPPGGEYLTHVLYPTDTTTAEGKTWTTSHDILFYRGPEAFTPAVTDDLSGIDGGALYQHYLFDDLGRLVKTRSLHPADTQDPEGYLTETLTSYDPLGKVFFTSLPYRVLAPPPADALDWASASRLTQAGDCFLTPIPRNPAEESHVSPYGSVTTFYSESAWPSAQDHSLTQLIAGTAELFDRPVLSFKPDGSRTRTTYSGLDTATTLFGIKTGEPLDPEAESTTWYRKDIWGHLRRVEPPLGTTAQYTYNGLDQLTGIDLSGQLRAFTYDALGRVLSARNPESGLTVYWGYDCIGNLLAVQDANGAAAQPPYLLANDYDAVGRLTATRKIRASDGQLLSTLLEDTYDRLGGVSRGASLGKIVKSLSRQELGEAAGVESAEASAYDPATGRVVSVTQSSTASGALESLTESLAYDGYGQVTGRTLPDGTLLADVYSHGMVAQRKVNGAPVLATLGYDPTGALTSVLFDTGESQVTRLDRFARPAGLAYLDSLQVPLWGNGVFANPGAPYTYDGAGNIASVGVTATQSDSFTYDALSRLVTAEVHRGEDLHRFVYTYDAFGNLTARGEVAPSAFQPTTLNAYLTTRLGLGANEAEEYIQETVFTAGIHETGQAKDNKIASVTRGAGTGLLPEPQPVPYTYDANGNLTSDGKFFYGYDSLNRQVQVRDGATGDLVAAYAYLPSGERTASIMYEGGSPADYARFFREGATVVWEKADSVGHAKSYLYAGGRMAYTHEAWTRRIRPLGLDGASTLLGTPAVTAPAGGETATATFPLSALPDQAEAAELRLVKGNALVATQRFDRPEGGWCGLEQATFAGLPEGADYQLGLTLFVREGRARILPPHAYLVERMRLGLVGGRLAAWTVARLKEEGGTAREESTAGFASLAPEGAEDYTARAKRGGTMEEVARGQEAEGVGLPADATALSIQGSGGDSLSLTAPTLGLAAGGGALPISTNHALRSYYGVDHLGTVRYIKVYDLAGNEVSSDTHDYEPFGVELPGGGPCANTHQFTGHERDAETGNDYMHFRMFAATLGRFMKPDSQYDGAESNPQGYNLYTYVKGNPVNWNDPTGHETPTQPTPKKIGGGQEGSAAPKVRISERTDTNPTATANNPAAAPPATAVPGSPSPKATGQAEPTQGQPPRVPTINITGTGPTTVNVNGPATVNVQGTGTTTVNVEAGAASGSPEESAPSGGGYSACRTAARNLEISGDIKLKIVAPTLVAVAGALGSASKLVPSAPASQILLAGSGGFTLAAGLCAAYGGVDLWASNMFKEAAEKR